MKEVLRLPNVTKKASDRTTVVTLTMPIWIVDEIDRRAEDGNRSRMVFSLCQKALSMEGDLQAVEYRLHEIEAEMTSLETERERLQSVKSEMSETMVPLDDPLVVEAVDVIAQRAVNYKVNEGVEMQDRAIRTMAEKYLNSPMPLGFIELVREKISGGRAF
jgi:hypothetical protein